MKSEDKIKKTKGKRPAIYTVVFLLWVGSMVFLYSHIKRQRTLLASGRTLAVFTEAFEENLRTKITLTMLGINIGQGEFIRRTREPFPGRRLVREHGYGGGTWRGTSLEFKYWGETRWDSNRGGFVDSRTVAYIKHPIAGTVKALLTATRGIKDKKPIILVRGQVGGKAMAPVTFPAHDGIDLSSDFLHPAPIPEMYVGAKWSAKHINPMSGEVVVAETEVVAKEDYNKEEVFRATQSVIKETGQKSEVGSCWYQFYGRPVRQKMLFAGIFSIDIKDIERLSASNEEFEKLLPPEQQSDDDGTDEVKNLKSKETTIE